MLRYNARPVHTCMTVLLGLAIVGAASATVFAQPADGQDRFKQWDKNQDDMLTPDELPPALRPNFDRVDTNRDGFISRAEHRAFVTRAPNAPAGNAAARGGRALSDKIEVKSDLPYADTKNPRQTLDLYLPKEPSAEQPLPLIVFIHGGAWRAGDKRGGIRQVDRFVETGEFAAASIGYRLSGEAQWPAQIHDCKAAIRYLKAHAKEYGIDPDRIAVFGTSAGGHLVAMLGVTGDVASLEGDLGLHTELSSRVKCVIDFFGPANFLTMNDSPSKIDHDSTTSPESLLIGGPIQENPEKAQAASPVKYITADDASILIMHGTKDPSVPFDQSVQFHAALQKAGVDATLVPVVDAGHGFGGKEINARVDQFLQKALLGREVEVSSEPVKAN